MNPILVTASDGLPLVELKKGLVLYLRRPTAAWRWPRSWTILPRGMFFTLWPSFAIRPAGGKDAVSIIASLGFTFPTQASLWMQLGLTGVTAIRAKFCRWVIEGWRKADGRTREEVKMDADST